MTAEYLENGKQISEKFCSTAKNQPTMLPRAPEQTYIDIYPVKKEAGPSFRDEKRRQSDYETEVKMYRALEGLDENYIVLHSFKNTHDQYRMCDGTHDRKTCKKCKFKFNIEGECDFLIICSNSFVVIEVKNMEHVHGEWVKCEPDFHLCSIGEDWEPECTTRDKQLRALIGTYRKSAEQRNKVAELIRCIDKDANILQFTAYPNFSKWFKEQFQLSDVELSTIIFEEDICRKSLNKSLNHSVTIESTSLTEQTYPEKNCFSRLVSCFSRCCNKDTDTDNTSSEGELLSGSENNPSNRELSMKGEIFSAFADWWAYNVTQATPSVRRVSENTVSSTEITISGYNKDSHEKAKNILLAIWATEKNKCDQSKCSLGKCIMDINNELKEGHIIFKPKTSKNPDVVKSPDVINNYVGVLNLTTEQNRVFNSNENLMWINGPAGTGKTVILCGKIIQIIQSDSDNKVVVFKFTGLGNNSQHYQCALDKAGIQYERINTIRSEHTPTQLANLITESVCRVIIVEMYYLDITVFTNKLSELSGYHVFLDDIQCMLDIDTTVEQFNDLINKLLELSENKKVWIACDMAQRWNVHYTPAIVLNLNSVLSVMLDTNQRRILTKNLRNTCDLSNILSVVRYQVVKLCSPELGILDLVLPTQSQGHFIHGPLTVIHVFNDFNVDNIVRVFNTELDRLCAEFKYLKYSDIGIVHTDNYSDLVPLVKRSVDKRCDNTDVKIAVCRSCNSSSAEWPAVVVLCEVWDYYNAYEYLSKLYTALSRARVHCTVIMYPNIRHLHVTFIREGRTLDTFPLLERLSNYARIIRY